MSFEIETVATFAYVAAVKWKPVCFADLVASPRREEQTTVVISGLVKGKNWFK